MVSNTVSFIVGLLFIENGKDIFELYVYVLLIFTMYSGIYVFNVFKKSINEIKKFVINSLFSFKETVNKSIDSCIDKLL